jgi:hypothetical protein
LRVHDTKVALPAVEASLAVGVTATALLGIRSELVAGDYSSCSQVAQGGAAAKRGLVRIIDDAGDALCEKHGLVARLLA